MDLQRLLFLGLAGLGAFLTVLAARGLVRVTRRRSEQRHLDRAGLIANGQVVAVEPMQRALNNAAGHAVGLAFQDAGGALRHARDTSGLGGYLARAGIPVTVRYSPANPALVRVETVTGRYGPYPVYPGRRPRPGSLAGGLVGLAIGAFITPLSVVLAILGGEAVADRLSGSLVEEVLLGWVFPGLFTVLGVVLLVVAVQSVVSRARRNRRRPRDEVVGVVTETWTERVGSGQHSTIVYPFTVHFATSDGREVHARSPNATSTFRPQPQQQVRIQHDREHPVWFEVVPLRHGTVLAALAALVGGIAFLIAGLIWFAQVLG